MSDIRDRLSRLLADSGTYQQGRHDERLRMLQLIDIRIDQLQAIAGIRNRHQLCAELLLIRQYLQE